MIVLARNPTNYQSVVDEINSTGGQATGISTDLSDSQGVKSAFEQIKSQFGNVPLAAAVFNSGGGFVRKPFLELTEEEFAGGFESQGYISPFFLTLSSLLFYMCGVNAENILMCIYDMYTGRAHSTSPKLFFLSSLQTQTPVHSTRLR